MGARVAGWIGVCLLAFAGPAAAQAQPARGRLLVTVADPSGAVIPNARVIVTGEGDRAAIAPIPAISSPAGLASIEDLAPGRYSVRVEFPGFETVTLKNLRIRAGDNRRSVALPIRKVAEDVTVGRDARTAALDPRGHAFSTVLTREQIELLPDDPDEMEAALKAMAPPGSILRIDGFTGGKLPPKSQIRSIRLPRMDLLAAQNHGGGMAGMMHIEIMSQPGSGPLRGSIDAAFRDDALNARNPFAPDKGDEGMRQGGVSFAGTIVPNRSSFSVSAQRARLFDSGTLLAAVPAATLADTVRRPTDRRLLNARFDQAVGSAHTLRLSYQRTAAAMRNLGVGGFDLPERAFSTDSTENIARVSENGPLGRRFFWESRAQLRWSDTRSRSATEAPALRVLDAFTSGGAQRSGGTRAADLEAAADLDYVRGTHSARVGVLLEAGRYQSDDATNYFGTYTFASLADYEAGRPANFTRRTGDPEIGFSNLQLGVYAQDDVRLRKSLMLSYGVRYEVQDLVADANNVSPRVSLTWSPFASGRTTLRGGFGAFSDWLAPGIYEQTLRFDGVRQREINVRNPSWPDAEDDVQVLPSNRYGLASGLELPEVISANAGIEHLLTPVLRLNGTYVYRRGQGQLRGRNLNAPVAGVRPDPSSGNVVEVTGDADSRVHQVGVTAVLLMLDWRQTFVAATYSLSSAQTNTSGAFALPANGDDPSTEWGPGGPRHRFSVAFNMRPVASLGISLNIRGQSGTPYTVTTGADANGDGLFNDRPDGHSRNAVAGAGQFDAGLRLSYAIGIGPRRTSAAPAGGPQVVAIGAGGGMPAGTGGAPGDRRFRLEIYASAQNITNYRNYIGYSGVLTSPFFGAPTNVLNPRKIELGARVGF